MARHLITSALPYVNGSKHLGNLVGSLLPADVTARWLRRCGHDVRFVCATDEHGAPAELAAAAAGQDTATFCADSHALQRSHYQALRLSFDVFGRTSDPAHHAQTRALYERLRARGLVEQRPLAQLYSPTDGRFLPDRYVLGTCPHCGGEARGDQCDACSRLLDPTDLLDPRSALSGSDQLQLRQTTHAFLRLSALQPQAEAYVTAHAHRWPALSASVARAWLAEGLQDRCISRDLGWGVPVPDLPGKVFWCWFDAPIGYLSLSDGWWGAPDVTVTQFLGKDNLPFHTIWFPAILAGAGLPQAADRIWASHWLSWYGQRFSTSKRRGVFLDRALQLLPADVWRWGLLAQAPQTSDSRFTWEQLAATVNKDLVGQLGNLVHRVNVLTLRQGATIPGGAPPGDREQALQRACAAAVAELGSALDALRFRDAIEALRGLFRHANRYLDDAAPWQQLAVAPGEGARTLSTAYAWIRLAAAALAPVLPDTSDQLFDVICATPAERRAPATALLELRGLAGRPLQARPPLFERLDPGVLSAACPPP